MNMLIKLAYDLLEGKPSQDKIDCARKVLESMINKPLVSDVPSDLDADAEEARRELT